MKDTPTISELPRLIQNGLDMVEWLQESGGEGIYDSIKAQLTYMNQTVDAQQKPSEYLFKRL